MSGPKGMKEPGKNGIRSEQQPGLFYYFIPLFGLDRTREPLEPLVLVLLSGYADEPERGEVGFGMVTKETFCVLLLRDRQQMDRF